MTRIVYGEIKNRGHHRVYWQKDVEALALEVERVPGRIEAAYCEGRRDGFNAALAKNRISGHIEASSSNGTWEDSNAKAALAAEEGGG